LILRKISKSDATRSQILRLKCTKFDFPMGLRPRPCWESLQCSPRPLALFNGPKGREREGEGGRREGRGGARPPSQTFWPRTAPALKGRKQ